MAALNRPRARVRAAIAGEGTAIAALWRELWDAHQAWGGYPGSHDPAVYARLATRLDDDARVRAGRPMLGCHAHLVADLGGPPCGQVEGWLEQEVALDAARLAPLTCEVRSLVVGERARRFGVGRTLLDALGRTARSVARGARTILAAEVLEPNPARAFYERVGFVPVAWSMMIDAALGARLGSRAYHPRSGAAPDAVAIATLETFLADRRRAAGDPRHEGPRPLDATLVASIAAHLGAEADGAADSGTLVAVDAGGVVRGAATILVQTLEPPFEPVRRALVGRFAFDPACAPGPLLASLVGLGCRFAEYQGASRVELTDLPAPGTDLHAAAGAVGATPWSRVVTRDAHG